MNSATWAKLERRPVLFVRSVVDLALAYLFASLAIDSGSLLQYALALFFMIMTLRNLFKGIFYKQR